MEIWQDSERKKIGLSKRSRPLQRHELLPYTELIQLTDMLFNLLLV